jgi:hypothetical protein
MPFNTGGFPNAGGDDDPTLFLGGDVRANEQVGLTAMHTLWVREHNRLARDLKAQIASMSGDDIYARVRAVVGATMQAITYQEFLPLLLGPNALRPYEGYRPDVTPGIANVFSTASFRLGHTLLSSSLRRVGSDGRTVPHGDLSLRDAFFAPQRIIAEGGIEPLLRGLAAQAAQDVDLMVVDDVRNFLFGPPGAGGFDLVSLNIQRGRDHGLPDYNAVRAALGLEPARSFADITPDRDLQRRLEAVYGDVHDIDPWVGGLAEAPVPGAMVGELISTVLVDQFERLRDGDRYWYEHVFSPAAVAEIEATRLSDVIRRNTTIGDEIQAEVFRLP